MTSGGDAFEAVNARVALERMDAAFRLREIFVDVIAQRLDDLLHFTEELEEAGLVLNDALHERHHFALLRFEAVLFDDRSNNAQDHGQLSQFAFDAHRRVLDLNRASIGGESRWQLIDGHFHRHDFREHLVQSQFQPIGNSGVEGSNKVKQRLPCLGRHQHSIHGAGTLIAHDTTAVNCKETLLDCVQLHFGIAIANRQGVERIGRRLNRRIQRARDAAILVARVDVQSSGKFARSHLLERAQRGADLLCDRGADERRNRDAQSEQDAVVVKWIKPRFSPSVSADLSPWRYLSNRAGPVTTIRSKAAGKVYSVGQLKYHYSLCGRPGDLQSGAWNKSGSHDAVVGPDTFHGNHGFYFGWDQLLVNEAANSDQGLGAFVIYSYAPNDRNTVGNHFATGLVYRGLLPRRDSDMLGLGCSWTEFSEELVGRETVQANELCYNIHVTGKLIVQPAMHYIEHPSGTLPDALDAGGRFGIEL